MKPYIRKIYTIQGLTSLADALKKQGFMPLVNPNISKVDFPMYMLIDPELALYSICTAEKAKEYEK